MFRVKVTYRMALVLVALSVGPVMVAALAGLIPMDDAALIEKRKQVIEKLANLCATNLERESGQGLVSKIEMLKKSDPSVLLVRVKRFDGLIFFQDRAFSTQWTLGTEQPSTLNQVRTPILRQGKSWAFLEAIFKPPAWYEQGLIRFLGIVAFVILMNAISFGFFLNRSLSVLEPNSAVPRRVRNTLDTIAGGVVVLDAKGRIMMANESFTRSVAVSDQAIIGKRLADFPWRINAGQLAPWDIVVEEQRRCEGAQVYLKVDDSPERCFVVNATPVQDANDRMAGCMVSFEDISALEEQRKSLVDAMAALAASKEEVRQQNLRLQELALRDSLTEAYNRRALYEQMEKGWNTLGFQPKGMIAMLMDIDFFKKLNDKHGHAAGDYVLKAFTKTLQRVVGDRGIAARYGGEEFCVVCENMTLDEGMQLAEKIRTAVEADLREPYAVTISVGVTTTLFNAESTTKLIEQADKALYAAKNAGRNRTLHWTAEIDSLQDKNKQQTLALRSLDIIDDHPISYHAVLSLHAALVFRHADTAFHSQRVAEIAVNIGRGLIPPNELYSLEVAGLLHDIGKIGVPDGILTKPGPLTKEEWEYMEAHGPIGVAIIETAFDSKAISDVLRYHHCRYDGKNDEPGWPSGKDIPIAARIIAIADTYDAMVSDRCYRKGRSHEEAIAELRRCAGGQFDPDLVERFINIKTGWRLDSRYLTDSTEFDRNILNIGYHLERVIHSFEVRDPVSMKLRLGMLRASAIKLDMMHIAAIVDELAKDTERNKASDWGSVLPILQDLIDVCTMLQRAHLRQVGALPNNIEHCKSHEFLLAFAANN